MKSKIEQPKVFISYAWSSTEYESKVNNFAEELVRSGVDVVYDKWSLNPGNDTITFMEKSVNDTSITNVIMLLDEVYAQKANERKGGVGTETQIISSEVYGKTEQDKFIPVVFEKGSDGTIYKPTYLKNTLHFDLAESENYLKEFQRLVRWLFGIQTYPKPSLGKKPGWVENPTSVGMVKKISYRDLENITDDKRQKIQFEKHMNSIKAEILSFDVGNIKANSSGVDQESYLEKYNETKLIRDSYLELINHSLYINEYDESIRDFFESINVELSKLNATGKYTEIKYILVHEMFIYTIAYLLRFKEYAGINKILNASYFDGNIQSSKVKTFVEIVSSTINGRQSILNSCVCKHNEANYFSGTAQLWMENINENYTQEEFVFADEILYNYSVFAYNFSPSHDWRPITYIYHGNPGNSTFSQFVSQLKSKARLVKILQLFGYNNVEKFKSACIEILKKYSGGNSAKYRFYLSYDDASFLLDYIKPEEIGSCN